VDERLRVVAAVINPPAYFADSTNSIAVRPGSKYRLEYILGILNSRLTQWRFKLTSTNNNVGTNELESLPFRTIDLNNADDKLRHDKIARSAEQMSATKKVLGAVKSEKDTSYYKSKCGALERQIDGLVYELYGLTDKEITLVESTE